MAKNTNKLIVIGVSAGGMETLSKLFSLLDARMMIPMIVVQHIAPNQELDFLMTHYSEIAGRVVKEAEEKEPIAAGTIYFAPPNYHLLIEADATLALSVEERLNYARPSIDVLFASAAAVYFSRLIAVVLTGANADGTAGAIEIKENGGIVIAQDPQQAFYPVMPQAVIDQLKVDKILTIEKIADYLNKLVVK